LLFIFTKKNMRYLSISFLLIFIYSSCIEKKQFSKTGISQKWVDSVKASSDTFYIKPYLRNKDFISGEYYFNRKDTIVSQFMKDSAGTIRQIIIAKKNMLRLFFAEYYANGQLKTKYLLDEKGFYNGPSTFYYENGAIKATGSFVHGLYSGSWKNYNEQQILISTDEYDPNGQLISHANK
ncbi:MAG: hypothetical protein ABJA78_16160, partial [Ferruginibacter sp.]